jgi:hypothetical protein
MNVKCASCEGKIEPGEVRYPTDEGTKHETCVLHDSLFDEYHFYFTNPSIKEGHAVSLWRVHGEREHPVMNYAEGIMTVNSSSRLFAGSDTIEPSEGFFNTVAYSVHSVLAFYPFGVEPLDPVSDRIEEEIDATIDAFYDENPPEHEERFIEALVHRILPHTSRYVIYELGPIRDYAQKCTEFAVPPVHPSLKKDE